MIIGGMNHRLPKSSNPVTALKGIETRQPEMGKEASDPLVQTQ